MTEEDTRPQKYVFLLLENFTLLAFSSAIEPLRLANWIAERPLYQWAIAAENGLPVTSSGKLRITPDMGLDEVSRDTIVVVVGGRDIKQSITKP
ncbi:MAG: GlxA family transcriptional regulator, partial [Pseudomonadota bacterium]